MLNSHSLKWNQSQLTTQRSFFYPNLRHQMSETDPGPVKVSLLTWSFYLCNPSMGTTDLQPRPKRERPSCSREDASCLNKHIDWWRAGSPWELWSPLPPPLCWFGLMGVWGEVGAKRRDRSFHRSFIAWPRVHSKTKQPSHAAQRRLSVTRRPLRTNRGIRHKSIISIGVLWSLQALVLWMGPLKQQNILKG